MASSYNAVKEFMHPIRLRGPWELEIVARYTEEAGVWKVAPTDLEAQRKATTLGDWGKLLGDDFYGQVRYNRRFNKPSGLSAKSRVHLIIEKVDWTARIKLNGQTLGELTYLSGIGKWDITELLRYRNELVVEVVCPEITPEATAIPRGEREGQSGGILGEVRLEIEESEAA